MMRTGIPVSVLEAEGDSVIYTMAELINAENPPDDQGFIDPDDPSTIPEEWK